MLLLQCFGRLDTDIFRVLFALKCINGMSLILLFIVRQSAIKYLSFVHAAKLSCRDTYYNTPYASRYFTFGIKAFT